MKNERDLWVDRFHERSPDAYAILRAICKYHIDHPRTPGGVIADLAKEVLEYVEQKPLNTILGINPQKS